MQRHVRTAIFTWLAFILACGIIISRSHFTTDLSAFLPRTPTAEQQLLMDQLKDGLASRLILVGIEGADASTRADLSKHMARQLRDDPYFVTVNNGEPVNTERDRAFLFENRYLLSPTVTPETFTKDGLRAAMAESIDMLASPAGLLVKSILPRDPTGEMLHLIEQMDSGRQPQLVEGVWASKDGKIALILAQTRASGADTDAQQQAMSAIKQAFDEAIKNKAIASDAKLLMSGPGVFSVQTRDAIKSQVRLIFVISSLIIAALLLLLYRSFSALALGFLPVLTGILAGVAAVSLGFGVVHGITLGFGTALIGEAVDYSIYLFIQSGHTADPQGADSQQNWIAHYWPTVRLGVLTSVFGFAALLLSGFPGLAQLGLYSITGLIAAAAMTRFVLPHLLPAGFHVRDVNTIGLRLSHLAQRAPSMRWIAIAMLITACVILYIHRSNIWNHELSSLSPVSAADLALDARLRADMGAPDVRYVVVVSGENQEAVLSSAEKLAAVLDPLVVQGKLAGFESPSRYLPSLATQKARQASLPDKAELMSRLEASVVGLPVRPQLFTPFLEDVKAAREQALLSAVDLENTSMAMALNALLIQRNGHWNALLPLSATTDDILAAEVKAAINSSPNAVFVDLKSESNKLYSGYLHEAILLSLAGLLAITGLLLFTLRSPSRVLRMILPLAAAVLTVTAGLVLFGQQLIILHLIGLLLVVAIGSNYTLFFDPPVPGPIEPHTFASLLFANIATVIGFGLLAFSTVPILQAMGMTVAPGVVLALIFAAVFAGHQTGRPT
ncbi:MAG TPA: MMPL family transporter [Methylophilaceae bacterium]|nr:MMPL family transporter [Methylophilaceae bacterium]